MIRKLLTVILSLIALVTATAQFSGLSLNYIEDFGLGRNPFRGKGFQIGTGVENISFDSGIVLSFRFNIANSISPTTTLLDSIEFDLEENAPNLGFAEGKYKRLSYIFETDFGYGKVFEPFISLGFISSTYSSRVNYILYEPIDCDCPTKNFFNLAVSSGMGFLTGMGFKIKPSETFIFDFRINYSGIWLKNRDDLKPIPELSSLSINDYGEPVVKYIQSSFVQNFTFKAGIIFKIPSDNSDNDGHSTNDDDGDNKQYDSQDYQITPNSNTTITTPSKSECEPLTPTGKKKT